MHVTPSWRRTIALLLLALGACAHGAFGGDGKYGKNAEEDYKAGMEELRTHNYVEATRYFEHVKTKYPFSKYAALGELRLADAKFDQDHMIEAADAYQQFVKLHPNHEEADYAAYRAGLAHWKEGPSDFFLFPPPAEKDLTQVRDAAKELASFVQKYPTSKYRPEAETLLARARGLLADHEWFVAEYYAKRGHWTGAAGRLEGLVRDYPGSPREPEALYALAQAYLKVDEKFRAQQALQQLIVKHPQDPRRAEAEKLLASLR
jgi:outer membrane protein assembly factor BamD